MKISRTSSACAFAIAASIAACNEPGGERTESASNDLSGARASSAPRRARLERLAAIDGLARLYVGHELRPGELVALDARPEGAVIAALAARPDFRTGLSARAAAFHAADGRGPGSQTSASLDPDAPLADAFAADAGEAVRFGRWLVASLAPRVAEELLGRIEAAIGQMTYRELVDAVRQAAKTGSGA